jgi:hypothetical protein
MRILQATFLLFFFLLTVLPHLCFATARSVFQPRSQSTNIVQDFIMRGFDFFYATHQSVDVVSSFAYQHSFKDARISEALFNTSQFGVSGSLVAGRSDADLLSDYFGLPQTYESELFFHPTIISCKYTAIICIHNLFQVQRTFLRIYVPFVMTKYALRPKEIVDNGEKVPFVSGYMDKGQATPQDTMIQALQNPKSFVSVDQLLYGKMRKSKKSTGVSEIRFEYGGAAYYTPKTQCALYGIFSIATGNDHESSYFFKPVVGNGGHYEFGAGISAHTELQDNGISKIMLHGVVNLTHLFNHQEKRSFDLFDNQILSRYMLVKVFDMLERQATGTARQLINVTTLLCNIHNKIQMDGLIGVSVQHNRNTGIIGYNAFLKSRDIVRMKEAIPEGSYALKGIQNLYTNGIVDEKTASTATIFGLPFSEQAAQADEDIIFIKNSDIDPDSAAMPFQITHKIFVAYEWQIRTKKGNTEPAITLGLEIEFEGINDSGSPIEPKTTLNQASIFGGFRISF